MTSLRRKGNLTANFEELIVLPSMKITPIGLDASPSINYDGISVTRLGETLPFGLL